MAKAYEQLYGLFAVAAWLVVTVVGVWVARTGSKSKSRAGVFGTSLNVLACLGMVMVCVKALRQ